MNDELKKSLTACLVRAGADIVRFAPASRFTDPALPKLFPGCRTVIGLAFRQLRGSKRGIEDGTTYYQYTTMGLETLEENVMPMALMRGSALLEQKGFSALPQRRNQTVMASDDGTNPEVDCTSIYRGKKAENQLDFDQCAIDSGLGERGLGGMLLTDEFGPFQRVCFILTDAEFDYDPVVKPHLCDRCGKCIASCPGHAISKEGKLDPWQCSAYYIGANRSKNPFMPADFLEGDPDRLAIIAGEADLTPERAREIISQLHFYPGMKHAYWASICGRACDTACYIHLEEKGVLTKKFHTLFRKRPEWKLSLEDENSK